MKKKQKANSYILYILTFFVTFSPNFAQSDENNLFSDKNRLAFGNYLFSEKDYFRAIDEFKPILENKWNDTLQFKIATSYFRMNKFYLAISEYQKLEPNSPLFIESKIEQFRTFFLLENYSILNEQISRVLSNKLFNNTKLQQLKNCTLLLSNSELPNETEFLSIFNGEDNGKILQFYKWKENPPYKNPTKAAILSAILPGLGKIYTNEVGDGITSFVLTGLFSYLAINKFSNNQQTSALIYTALATFFYSGNIYGSYASAQNYNAGIKFNFENEVKIFVNDRNQFLPIPKFLSD